MAEPELNLSGLNLVSNQPEKTLTDLNLSGFNPQPIAESAFDLDVSALNIKPIVLDEKPKGSQKGRLSSALSSLAQGIGSGVGRILRGYAIAGKEKPNLPEVLKRIGQNTAQAEKAVSESDTSFLRAYRQADKEAQRQFETTVKDRLQEAMDSPIYKAGLSVDQFFKQSFPINRQYEGEFWSSSVPRALGEASVYLGGALISRGALSGPLGATGAGAVSSYVTPAYLGSVATRAAQFEDALNHDADIATALEAGNFGALVGVTEGIPIGNLLNRIDDASGGVVRNLIVRAAKAGTENAIQEMLSGVMLAASAAKLYDPERGVWTYDRLQEGTVGFVTGALFETLLSAVSGKRLRGQVEIDPVTDNSSPEIPANSPEISGPDFDVLLPEAIEPGDIETAQAKAADLSPEDQASPIPDEIIAAGRAELAGIDASETANQRLRLAGLEIDDAVAYRDDQGEVIIGALTDVSGDNVIVSLPSQDGSGPAKVSVPMAMLPDRVVPADQAESLLPSVSVDPEPLVITTIEGSADTAITDAGREVPVEYAVVEASDLVASQTDDGEINPDYPTDLPGVRGMPRSRMMRANLLSQNLDPTRLDRSDQAASRGAPIIDADGVIESGNLRVLGLRMAYQQGLAEPYRAHLAAQGYPVEGMQEPVLVRVRAQPLSAYDRLAFAMEANQPREHLAPRLPSLPPPVGRAPSQPLPQPAASVTPASQPLPQPPVMPPTSVTPGIEPPPASGAPLLPLPAEDRNKPQVSMQTVGKQLVVRNVTGKNQKRIKSAAVNYKPLYNRRLKGWVFPVSRETEVRDALADLLGEGGAERSTRPVSESETRPGTTPRQKQLARSSVDSLEAWIRRVGGDAQILGQQMVDNFRAGQPNQLLGQRVSSMTDLALLAQVYRNPKFETLRFVLAYDGEVVGETGFSSRVPGSVTFGDNQKASNILMEEMKRLNANEYWLIHNHPSGSAEPSSADVAFTLNLSMLVDGFKGHVVIDQNEYGTINEYGVKEIIKKNFGKKDFLANPARPHPLLGQKLNSSGKLAEMAKNLQNKSLFVAITTDAQLRVAFIVSLPIDFFVNASNKRGLALFRRLLRETGSGGRSFLIFPENLKKDDHRFKSAVKVSNMFFEDFIDSNGNTWSRNVSGPATSDIYPLLKKGVVVVREDPPQATLTEEYVGNALAKSRPILSDFLGIDVEVVKSVSDLPGEATVTDAKGGVLARRLYVVADAHTSISDVLSTVAQQVAGVIGLEHTMPRDAWDDLQTRIANLTERSTVAKAIMRQASQAHDSADDPSRTKAFLALAVIQDDLDRPMKDLLRFVRPKISMHLRNVGLNYPLSTKQIDQLMQSQPDYKSTRNSQFSVFRRIANATPLDYVFKLPFDHFGGVDNENRWVLGVNGYDRLTDWIKNARVDESVPFARPLNGMLEYLRVGLIDRYGLPKEYIDRDRQRKIDRQNIIDEAEKLVGGILEAGLNTDESLVLFSALTGKEIPPDNLKNLSDSIIEAIDLMSLRAVDAGLLSLEAYERNRGKYLHRVYQKHEAAGKFFYQTFRDTVTRKIKGDQFKGRGKFEPVSIDKLKKHLNADDEVSKGDKFRIIESIDKNGRVYRRSFIPSDKVIPEKIRFSRSLGVWEVRGFKKGKAVLWQDYTDAERFEMGEIRDPSYAVAKTFFLMADDLSTGEFFADIASNPEWSRDDEPLESTWMKAGDYTSDQFYNYDIDWVLVPDTTIRNSQTKRYGKLAGRYVQSAIWRDITEIEDIQTSSLWRELLAMWKRNKTIYSPVVHVNNVMSNFIFMYMADVRPIDFARAIKSWATKGIMYQEAKANGVFQNNLVANELAQSAIQPVLKDLQKNNTETNSIKGKLTFLLKLYAGLGKAWQSTWGRYADWMQKAYQSEDSIARLAVYIRDRDRGGSIKRSANLAITQMLDYDIRAKAINTIIFRRGFLPFFGFSYRASTRMAEALFYRPWKYLILLAVGFGLERLFHAMRGDDEEDRDQQNRLLREEERGSLFGIGPKRLFPTPMIDENGNPVNIDIRRFFPLSDVFDQGHSYWITPLPLTPTGPLVMLGETFLNRSAFLDKPIVNKLTDTKTEQMLKFTDYVWKSWMPSMPLIPYSHYNNKILRAVRGGLDPKGNPYTVNQALLSSIGIKLRPIDVEILAQWRAGDFAAVDRELRQELRMLQRRYERRLISAKERDREIEKIKNKFFTLNKNRARTLYGKDIEDVNDEG